MFPDFLPLLCSLSTIYQTERMENHNNVQFAMIIPPSPSQCQENTSLHVTFPGAPTIPHLSKSPLVAPCDEMIEENQNTKIQPYHLRQSVGRKGKKISKGTRSIKKEGRTWIQRQKSNRWAKNVSSNNKNIFCGHRLFRFYCSCKNPGR
jgi:hypothetical protein